MTFWHSFKNLGVRLDNRLVEISRKMPCSVVQCRKLSHFSTSFLFRFPYYYKKHPQNWRKSSKSWGFDPLFLKKKRNRGFLLQQDEFRHRFGACWCKTFQKIDFLSADHCAECNRHLLRMRQTPSQASTVPFSNNSVISSRYIRLLRFAPIHSRPSWPAYYENHRL